MIWKKIKNFENYEVSNIGSVRNVRSGTTLYQQRKGIGGKRVILIKDGQRKNMAVDRLVANAFFPGDHSDCDIIHINGDPIDNSASNLMFVKKRPKKRIRVVEYDTYYDSRRDCCSAMNIRSGTLSECLSGKRKHYKGLRFEEVD